MLIQAALILTAIATLVQLFPIFQKVGAGLPVIMGTSFAYVPTLEAIGAEFNLGTIMAIILNLILPKEQPGEENAADKNFSRVQ